MGYIKTKAGFVVWGREQLFCNRCNKPLISEKALWLELDQDTGLYHAGSIPDGHTSQGSFPFGADCEAAELAKTMKARGVKP